MPEILGSRNESVLALNHCSEPQLPTVNGSRNGHSRFNLLAIPASPAPGSGLAPAGLPEVPRADAPLVANPAPPVPAPLSPRPTAPVTSAPVPAPILKGRPRTGAVACLPKDERDMVCRMLESQVPYKRIVEALDHLGFVLTERNISNWVTHGGYAEWCAVFDNAVQTRLRQDDLLEHHRHENSPELAEVGLQATAVRLSELLLHQMSSNQPLEGQVSKLEPVINLLCRINKELFTLQKYRDDCQTKIFRTPARIKAEERKNLLLHEMVYSAEPKPKSPGTPAPGASAAPASPASAPPQATVASSSATGNASAAPASVPQADSPPPAITTSEPPK